MCRHHRTGGLTPSTAHCRKSLYFHALSLSQLTSYHSHIEDFSNQTEIDHLSSCCEKGFCMRVSMFDPLHQCCLCKNYDKWLELFYFSTFLEEFHIDHKNPSYPLHAIHCHQFLKSTKVRVHPFPHIGQIHIYQFHH